MSKPNEDKKAPALPHTVFVENRALMNVAGVEDVDCFDEQAMRVLTNMGELIIKGRELRINRLSVETGELSVSGKIYAMEYSDDRPGKGGILSKLFR